MFFSSQCQAMYHVLNTCSWTPARFGCAEGPLRSICNGRGHLFWAIGRLVPSVMRNVKEAGLASLLTIMRGGGISEMT
jgi:hypothetical protein